MSGDGGLKIASGWAKGMQLQVPKGLATRPTSGRVRAAVLNMLQPYSGGARVLDLFAGSGAMLVELVSRGAKGGLLVEVAPAAIRCLEANVAELERRAIAQSIEPPAIELFRGRVLDALRRLTDDLLQRGAGANGFDIIWADPPYQDAALVWQQLLDSCPKLLEPGGLLAFECASTDKGVTIPPEEYLADHALSVERDRSWGGTRVLIVKRS